MKKQWNNPEVKGLNVAATKEGPHPTENHDATTYDTVGDWWAGGES